MMYVWPVGTGIVALIGGGVAEWAFIALTSKLIGLGGKPDKDAPRIPPWLTGVIERAFFLLLVVSEVEGVPESMMGWLAIKLASNWQRYDPEKEPTAQTRASRTACGLDLSCIRISRWCGYPWEDLSWHLTI
jgi:hypothetical protein